MTSPGSIEQATTKIIVRTHGVFPPQRIRVQHYTLPVANGQHGVRYRGGEDLGRDSDLPIPLTGAPESLPRARSSPSSRVHVPGTLPVRRCPGATDGLDGQRARLQDRGTGGMAPLAVPRASAGLVGAVCVWRAPGVRREPGAAVAP